ncbi:unnamed protein product [Nesidiocoris tenuis]|uniref:Uncharacterized protein n=1 Tax=Nesidiocoris tenuis TaxID=355587 RepID=A0A6H5FVN9_9HEMI|nr:unnamed protein product [Nesidiocoris tenuis]
MESFSKSDNQPAYSTDAWTWGERVGKSEFEKDGRPKSVGEGFLTGFPRQYASSWSKPQLTGPTAPKSDQRPPSQRRGHFESLNRNWDGILVILA